MTQKTKFKVGDPVVIVFAYSLGLYGKRGFIKEIGKYGELHVADHDGNLLGTWEKESSLELDEIYYTPLWQALK